ncbi:sugar-transfer associated ATP-grasp domain-containing protein [Flavivirga aquimarina]|uniref:Sugar-transfer associated ATP-grasp domain-containing protein n=1 Tax=Flavivirga aquimarina TaxID=2027862 RepID=A0ABT8WEK0_9FLAO|nr:sugar-transfer associated ATP-grasp domain-containing protein [Flavivirga aquimarina]MDO5971538.1 sugar-transfer associated ATP-grasp domain-containing protein [Flavivirga aquimarina]
MNRIKVFLKHPNKKSIPKMVKEILVLLVKKREIPFYYFKYLYRKDAIDYLDHLSLKEQRKLQYDKSLHNQDYVSVINNKLYFALLNKNDLIKTPKLIAYNYKSSFFHNDTLIHISTEKELIHFFEKIFNNQNVDGVFLRPHSDYGGHGCFKITKDNFIKELKVKSKILINGNFVHTEVIKQHDSINQIHSKSINTIRIITLLTPQKEVEIISVSIRFGVGDSVVDNASSGGFFVGVDLNDGILQSKGHYLPQFGGGEITRHPDSGFVFAGFKIPYYKEACESVKSGVKVIPDGLIGWDVAITPDGPVIIETNAEPHIQICNIISGGLLKNKHVKNLIEELKTKAK